MFHPFHPNLARALNRSLGDFAYDARDRPKHRDDDDEKEYVENLAGIILSILGGSDTASEDENPKKMQSSSRSLANAAAAPPRKFQRGERQQRLRQETPSSEGAGNPIGRYLFTK